MKFSQKGMRLLAKWEGLVLRIYKCSAGCPTIGIGHKLTKKEIIGGKFKGGITEDEAYELCHKDLTGFEYIINRLVLAPLTQDQYDAMVIFTFNIGAGGFATSQVLNKINLRLYDEVPDRIRMWNKVTKDGMKVKDHGLVNRRENEVKLWNGEL
jgi:lysozyme